MDLLSQHEAFLRAIYDDPDDDTPRLVYADFLEENGDPDRAAFIRYACELALSDETDLRWVQLEEETESLLQKQRVPPSAQPDGTIAQNTSPLTWPWAESQTVRGFPLAAKLATIPAKSLTDVNQLRTDVVHSTPEFFGAKRLKVIPPPRVGGELIGMLLKLPFIQQVSELDMSGHALTASDIVHDLEPDFDYFPMPVVGSVMPAINNAGVNAISYYRGSRRFTALDLRNNQLDDDAARGLVKSPYLGNLKRLELLEGNRFRGRVWQQVIERFGEEVVG